MGATKRICELYAQNSNTISQRDKQKATTDIVAVRFGNVLGSSGSVIPKFQSQIDNDKNITLTHKDITRYFMLISRSLRASFASRCIGRGWRDIYS